MTYDVISVGGSYAGMAAVLQLLRARRTVLVIDAAHRRNRAAAHSYGFLGQDGVDPAELARQARTQLLAYPTLTWVDGEATSVTGSKDAFEVQCGEQTHSGRRVLFATGVRDDLPDIPGLMERWGRTVHHCPYCHGYELDMGAIGVIATSPMSVHQAEIVAEWGQTTFSPMDHSSSTESRPTAWRVGACKWNQPLFEASRATPMCCWQTADDSSSPGFSPRREMRLPLPWLGNWAVKWPRRRSAARSGQPTRSRPA